MFDCLILISCSDSSNTCYGYIGMVGSYFCCGCRSRGLSWLSVGGDGEDREWLVFQREESVQKLFTGEEGQYSVLYTFSPKK